MITFARSHDENRCNMCLFCKQKPKGKSFKTTGKIGNEIKKLFPNFDVNDFNLPAVVCDACRIKISKANKNEISKSSIQMPNYSNYTSKVKTRSSCTSENICECTLCVEVRSRQSDVSKINMKKKSATRSFPVGKRCAQCLTILSKGTFIYLLFTLMNVCFNSW